MIDRGQSDRRERRLGCWTRRAFCLVNRLVRPDRIERYRAWKKLVMSQAACRNLTFTHRGASKPTNSCLKSRFVSAGHHAHALLKSRHPLIDDVILSSLARHAIGGYWMHAAGGRSLSPRATSGRSRPSDCA